ncbi:hypothetical protein N5J43_30115 [Pseudomonas nicosulfuronedens]|uniref:hypothetical protein n=1 Tax=Pseudomonas nicosulfuronedens TaxID=2571105 RepID=UPI00244B1168|nr:hypothetical protein [Pseudomonas nicosulfuronedens]MDH1013070.1 hypothetical protein [Pseudomonas nicosulfuronedens]MDH1983233.1 hypothetical protein [Pseudomonas nicosulfuronedens]MDH2030861.1 hypothetical protein [Pseudomonas nicosulfuronedens]
MKLKTLAAALLIGSSLVGCEFPAQQSQAKAASPLNWVSVPALPIIEDAVMSLAPTFQGKRTEQFMPQICGMARGQLSQEQVNTQLTQMGIDVSRIPRQSQDATALLVNRDRAAQATACAAYQATSVLMAVDARAFLKPAPATGEKAAEKTPAQPQLDERALASVLPIKVAQARANADIFALIAENLQRTPGQSLAEYRERARSVQPPGADLPRPSASEAATGRRQLPDGRASEWPPGFHQQRRRPFRLRRRPGPGPDPERRALVRQRAIARPGLSPARSLLPT